MDFTIQKPTHLIALLLLLTTILLTIILPIFSYIGLFPSTTTLPFDELPPQYQQTFEIVLLLTQLILIMGLFIGVPLIWYVLVNKFDRKKILEHLRLTKQNLDLAVIWGIFMVITGFSLIIFIDLILTAIGFNVTDASNIQDLQQFFSLPALFILITIQPIGEEIFFRGFLFEKIEKTLNPWAAILITAILFGIAHLSYAKIYPALMTILIGFLFGLLILKTKNLYASILAHILFNLISFTAYVLAQSLNLLESVIL